MVQKRSSVTEAVLCFSAFSNASESKQTARIPAEYLDLVVVRNRRSLQPVGAHLVRREGPVDREHDAVDAHLHHAADQRVGGKVAAGREMEVLAELRAERTGGIARPRQCLVDPAKQERNSLAEMTENHLELGIGIEQAAEDHAHA